MYLKEYEIPFKKKRYEIEVCIIFFGLYFIKKKYILMIDKYYHISIVR